MSSACSDLTVDFLNIDIHFIWVILWDGLLQSKTFDKIMNVHYSGKECTAAYR